MSAKLFCSSFLLIFLLCISNSLGSSSENATARPKQTFKEAEKEVTSFINDQLRSLLPRVVGGAGASNLTQKCMAGMMKILGNVRRLKGWTIKILDSFGKPSAGILKGTSYSLGHYDQCVDLMVNNKGVETANISEAIFQGMYCKVRMQFNEPIMEAGRDYYKGKRNASELGKLKELIQATPYLPVTSEFMSHFLGVCLPSSCTIEDVNEILLTIPLPGSARVDRCETKSTAELNKTQTTVLIIFFILICVIFASTFLHWLLHNGTEDITASHKDCRCVSVMVSVSLCNNARRLMKNIEDDADHALAGHCVRGIVVASIAWIILGHTYLLPYDAFYMQSSSLENLQHYLIEEYFTLIVNYPLAIDALFVSYGFIMTYTLWNSACKAQDIKVSIFSLIVRNYLRIFIPVLVFLGTVILLPLIGSGPFWNDFMDSAISKCYQNPWAYVGMYSNYLEKDEQCFPHLWFPSCLAQLTLAGVILCWILSRNMKFGITLVVLLALAGNITVGMYTFKNDFAPSYVAYFAESESSLFWKLNYSLPLSHFGPYALGMLTGIVVARSNQPLRKFLAAVGWIICLCVLIGLMLFIHKYHLEPMGALWSAAYAGSHRTLFAGCVAWVILASSLGNGGFINAVFSWRVFDPLFKLSYYCYIFHFIVIAVTVGASREHFNYAHLDLIMKAISYISVSYFVSFLMYMILEMPVKSLCSFLCRKRSNQINVTSLNNLNMQKTDILIPNSTITGSCKLWSVSNSAKLY